MAKFKVLGSIAHNTAHSYLSLMNYIDGNYIVEYIFQISKANRNTSVMIDIINKSISPEMYNISQIVKSLDYLNNNFLSLLKAESMSFEHIKSAVIRIEFDLDKINKSEKVLGLELPTYECISEIIDINNKIHKASVVEWWRY